MAISIAFLAVAFSAGGRIVFCLPALLPVHVRPPHQFHPPLHFLISPHSLPPYATSHPLTGYGELLRTGFSTIVFAADQTALTFATTRRTVPLHVHGLLMPADVAAVWRGPMVMSAVAKLVRGTEWGRLDVFVVDMPPGIVDSDSYPLAHSLLLLSSIHPSTIPFVHPSTLPLFHSSTHSPSHSSIHPPIHPPTLPFIHPFTLPLFHSSTHSPSHSSIHPPIHPPTLPFIHPFTLPLFHSSTHSPSHSSIHPPIHPPTLPFIHPFTLPLFHSSTHSPSHSSIHPPIHPPTLLFIHPCTLPLFHSSTHSPSHSSIHPPIHPPQFALPFFHLSTLERRDVILSCIMGAAQWEKRRWWEWEGSAESCAWQHEYSAPCHLSRLPIAFSHAVSLSCFATSHALPPPMHDRCTSGLTSLTLLEVRRIAANGAPVSSSSRSSHVRQAGGGRRWSAGLRAAAVLAGGGSKQANNDEKGKAMEGDGDGW
ncbi:unnamed protein product [Closterium sp. Naga37s-1]|nr:unnamed protein product [Closterium sp. Naga37s-1]